MKDETRLDIVMKGLDTLQRYCGDAMIGCEIPLEKRLEFARAKQTVLMAHREVRKMYYTIQDAEEAVLKAHMAQE